MNRRSAESNLIVALYKQRTDQSLKMSNSHIEERGGTVVFHIQWQIVFARGYSSESFHTLRVVQVLIMKLKMCVSLTTKLFTSSEYTHPGIPFGPAVILEIRATPAQTWCKWGTKISYLFNSIGKNMTGVYAKDTELYWFLSCWALLSVLTCCTVLLNSFVWTCVRWCFDHFVYLECAIWTTSFVISLSRRLLLSIHQFSFFISFPLDSFFFAQWRTVGRVSLLQLFALDMHLKMRLLTISFTWWLQLIHHLSVAQRESWFHPFFFCISIYSY